MAQTEQVQEHLGTALSLERRVDVFPEAPLPELDGPGGPAFTARHKGDTRADLMALLCTKALPPRAEFANAMRTIDNPCILRVRENGVVHWPARNSSYMAFAYERPLAPRYWLSLNETHAPMSEDLANQYFVTPMASALAELQRTGIVHGGFRPTNIFWREGGASLPQLGECLSAPAGIGQPVLFETIERGMCAPSGRGPGIHADDCYAFGVMMACIIFGCNPLPGLDDQAILQSKMEQGSFNAIIGTRRLGSPHIEMLRGLLIDDAKQRWSASDIDQWLAGRRLTPKSADTGRRAARHLPFAGKEYWQVRPLATAMAENVSEAAKIIEDNSLGKWLTRSFGDDNRTEDVNEARAYLKASAKSAHYEDQLVARACLAIDPASPIRYRGLTLLPGGIAMMLAEAMMSGTNTQVLSEIITNQFVTFWVNLQKEVKTDLVPFAQQLERVRTMIEKTTFGNGLERATYEMNPSLPCLSPMMRGQYVISARQVLPTLERVANQSDRPSEPMDRHLAAFLVVRDKRSEMLFASMAPTETPMRRGLAMLTLFSEMQYRYGPDRLPRMAAWLYPLVETSIKRFLSKPFQDKVRRQAKAAVDQGDLAKLMRLVDDPKRIEHDEQEFMMARRMYLDIQSEMASLEAELGNRDNIVHSVGRPIAASIATLLAILLLAVALGRAMLQSLV